VTDEDRPTAQQMRRRILGDAYVDRQTADPNPTLREFQDFITEAAWGVWARGGDILSTRDRSLIVMAITAALGRMEEFTLHAVSSGRAGVSPAEVDELLFQIAAYAGAPAGVAAKRAVVAARAAERASESDDQHA
jgi:4-carboxymuconolactone decarboxylase